MVEANWVDSSSGTPHPHLSRWSSPQPRPDPAGRVSAAPSMDGLDPTSIGAVPPVAFTSGARTIATARFSNRAGSQLRIDEGYTLPSPRAQPRATVQLTN